jgi:hypothetical protein
LFPCDVPFLLVIQGYVGQNPVTLRPVSVFHGVDNKVKVKLSLYRPWRPLGLREVEAPTLSDIWHIDGGKVIIHMPRPLFTPRKIPGTHFC